MCRSHKSIESSINNSIPICPIASRCPRTKNVGQGTKKGRLVLFLNTAYCMFTVPTYLLSVPPIIEGQLLLSQLSRVWDSILPIYINIQRFIYTYYTIIYIIILFRYINNYRQRCPIHMCLDKWDMQGQDGTAWDMWGQEGHTGTGWDILGLTGQCGQMGRSGRIGQQGLLGRLKIEQK